MNFSRHGCSPVTMVTSQIFKSHMYLWQSRWRCSFPGRCCLCWVCNTRTSPDLQTGASGWPAGPYRPSPSPPSPRRFSPGAETERKGSPCLWWTPRPSAAPRNRLCTETTRSPACGDLRTPRRNRAGRGGSLRRGTRVRLEPLRPDTQRTGALQKKQNKQRAKEWGIARRGCIDKFPWVTSITGSLMQRSIFWADDWLTRNQYVK